MTFCIGRAFSRLGLKNICRAQHLFGSVGLKPLPSIVSSTRRFFHPSLQRQGSKVDGMLGEFLKDEIEAEKKIAQQNLPRGDVPLVPGFKVTTNEDEVTLSKKHGDESIEIKFHVSNSVDTDPDVRVNEEDEHQTPAVISRPSFTVSVAKENQHLVFECEFIEPFADDTAEQEQSPNDVADMFNIEELYMHDGKAGELTYAVRGDVIDGGLYDHLMTYLEERGIDNSFAESLMKFATHYEHAQYVALLQKIRDFVDR